MKHRKYLNINLPREKFIRGPKLPGSKNSARILTCIDLKFPVSFGNNGLPSRKHIDNIDDLLMLSSKKQACSLKRQRCDIDATLMKQ